MSRWHVFDRNTICLGSVGDRGHDLRAADVVSSIRRSAVTRARINSEFVSVLRSAVRAGSAVILMMGGHSIKLGLQPYLIDLIERRLVTHVATNGSGIIHDFELAAVGGTSEDVGKWIQAGQFGLWHETSRLNEIVCEGAARGESLGESVGRVIEEDRLPYRHLSVAAAGYRCGIPVTSHVTVGADIIHSHPNCDGAALGKTSYTDFLIFARAVQDLEGGVFLNVGSAVTGPEVFLKALSMARNVAHQHGKQIRNFTTAVFDLVNLPANWRDGPPSKNDPLYYFRPWKTLLCRTVADGGKSFYIPGNFRETIPALWHELVNVQDQPAEAPT